MTPGDMVGTAIRTAIRTGVRVLTMLDLLIPIRILCDPTIFMSIPKHCIAPPSSQIGWASEAGFMTPMPMPTPTPTPTPPIPPIIPCGGSCSSEQAPSARFASPFHPPPDRRRRRHTQSSARALTLPTLSTASVVWSVRRFCVEVPSHHPVRCQPQFLKTHSLAIAAAPTTLTSPARSHLSEQLSSSHVGRRILEKYHRLESRAMAPRLVHLSQSHRPILKLHRIPPSRHPFVHRDVQRANPPLVPIGPRRERHAHNTQVAHDILWCTHRNDYPPQCVHVRRHWLSNSRAASGGTPRRTGLH